MAVYRGMKPMLEFTKVPQYVQDRPKRRRQRVKTPDNPRVKAISHDRDNQNDIKWVSPQFTVEDNVCRKRTRQRAKKELVPLDIRTRKSRMYHLQPVGLKFDDEDSPHISLYPSLAPHMLSRRQRGKNPQLDTNSVDGDGSIDLTDESDVLMADGGYPDDRVNDNAVAHVHEDQTVPDILKTSIAYPIPMSMSPIETSQDVEHSEYQLSSSIQDMDERKLVISVGKHSLEEKRLVHTQSSSDDDETQLVHTECSSDDDETQLGHTKSRSDDDETQLGHTKSRSDDDETQLDHNTHNLTTSVIELSDLVSNMSIESAHPQPSYNPPLATDNNQSANNIRSVKCSIFKPPSTSTPCRDELRHSHSLHLNTMASTICCEATKLESQPIKHAQNSLYSVRMQSSPSQPPVSIATTPALISYDLNLQITESENEDSGCSIFAQETPQHLWTTPELKVIDNTFS